MRLNERLLDAEQYQRRKATADTVRKIVDWEIWECADASFSHDYDRTVSLYVQQGAAVLTFATGDQLDLQAGDFLTIEAGAHADWAITEPLRNSYCYHDTFESAVQRTSQVRWADDG